MDISYFKILLKKGFLRRDWEWETLAERNLNLDMKNSDNLSASEMNLSLADAVELWKKFLFLTIKHYVWENSTEGPRFGRHHTLSRHWAQKWKFTPYKNNV